MKKLLIALMASLLLVACVKPPVKKGDIADMSDHGIKSEQFLVMTLEEAYDFLSKDTGYVYFGFSACPWCRDMIPLLDAIAKEEKGNVYYVDLRPAGVDIRVDDNEAYMKVVDLTKEFLSNDSDGKPRIFVPQLFAVKDGNIVFSHLGTVKSHDARERPMSDEETEELNNILKDFWRSIK